MLILSFKSTLLYLPSQEVLILPLPLCSLSTPSGQKVTVQFKMIFSFFTFLCLIEKRKSSSNYKLIVWRSSLIGSLSVLKCISNIYKYVYMCIYIYIHIHMYILVYIFLNYSVHSVLFFISSRCTA